MARNSSARANWELAASRLTLLLAVVALSGKGRAQADSKAKPSETRAKVPRKVFAPQFIRSFDSPVKSYSLTLFIREDDSAARIDLAMDWACARISAVEPPGAGTEVRILHPLNVIPSFAIGWHTMSPVHRSLSSIVRRQGQVEVAIVALQQSF